MPKEIFIIGGGNSVKDIDHDKFEGEDVMVLNKSIIDFPDAKYFVTMDYSFLQKVDKIQKVMKDFKGTKFFIGNLVPQYMEEKAGLIVDTRWNIKYNLKLFDVIIKSRGVESLGYTWNDFRNGSNTGYGALQLAVLLGYTTINLVGYDLTTEGYNTTHYHGGYQENINTFNEKLELYYKVLEDLFMKLKLEQSNLKIYNCSKISKLKKILPYKDLS